MLLAPLDFVERRQYLHARGTLLRLLELGVVPVVNENDAIADDEIRFGDNDRIAALVAHLVGADLLVLLTDAPGLLTADPRLDPSASLIEEIVEVDQALEAVAGGPGTVGGSGGMASKVAAAKIAAWSGVRTVIAAADRPDVLADAVAGRAGGGHRGAAPRAQAARPASSGSRSPSAPPAPWWSTPGPAPLSSGAGCRCCPPGWSSARGAFDADDAVEIADADGVVFAKGLVRAPAARGAHGGRSPQRRPARGLPPVPGARRRPGDAALAPGVRRHGTRH